MMMTALKAHNFRRFLIITFFLHFSAKSTFLSWKWRYFSVTRCWRQTIHCFFYWFASRSRVESARGGIYSWIDFCHFDITFFLWLHWQIDVAVSSRFTASYRKVNLKIHALIYGGIFSLLYRRIKQEWEDALIRNRDIEQSAHFHPSLIIHVFIASKIGSWKFRLNACVAMFVKWISFSSLSEVEKSSRCPRFLHL